MALDKQERQSGSVDWLPIDGDLNGYLSGRSTLTFHTPPSYGAAMRQKKKKCGN